jgi:hypothetical protein
VKLFKLKLILGVLVPALFISSCSSPRLDELTVRETALQKGIEAKTDNCELVWLLETYASWAEIDLYSLEPSEATNIASKLKNYTQDVLNLNKLDLNLGPEYFNDLGFVLEKISSTDLAARFLREIGRTYFPTCGYFSVDEALEVPQEQESQPELKMDEEIAPDPETGVDISALPSGKRNSNAYANGVEQANAFITTGGLTRATYSDLGGLENSCKFILDTFMLLSGGASTPQQYADFLLGCSVVIKKWY